MREDLLDIPAAFDNDAVAFYICAGQWSDLEAIVSEVAVLPDGRPYDGRLWW